MNAEDRYVKNINELTNSGINCIEIIDMKYSLEDLIKEYT